MTTHDYANLLWDESADLASFVEEIDDASFDAPSLCEGWRVRDVLSHMIVGHTLPLVQIVSAVALRGRGNVPKASFLMSKEYGSAHPPSELRSAWRSIVSNRTKRGIAKVISDKEGFVDHLIHHQDMRRPLGMARTIPSARVVAALDALPTIGGFLKSKQRMAGLRWAAADAEWAWGSGPEVRGPGEALIMLAGGRGAALADVDGPGVETLRQRM